MREQEIHQRIYTAVDHASPDVLGNILAACGPQAPALSVTAPRRPARRWAPMAVAAALAVALLGGFGVERWRAANTVDSTVLLDVNPSISIQANARERVLAVEALNDDAVTILGDMDLTGAQLDVAVNALIGSMLQTGYLTELQNAILVSVENQDTAKSARLQQQITDTINAVFQGGKLEGAVLSQTVAEDDALTALAQEYGVSLGKAALIQEVAAQDGRLSVASLAPLTVSEIALLSESRQAEAQTVTRTGSASSKGYIGETAAAEAAFRHAGIGAKAAQRLEVELDSEDGVMVYEVEFRTADAKYEYDIDARTGAVVKQERKSLGGGNSGGSASGTTGGNSSGTPTGSATEKLIGEAAARKAALAHAGVQNGKAKDLTCTLDWDDGTPEYQIRFRVGDVVYVYEIRGTDGVVLDVDRDTNRDDDWDDDRKDDKDDKDDRNDDKDDRDDDKDDDKDDRDDDNDDQDDDNGDDWDDDNDDD